MRDEHDETLSPDRQPLEPDELTPRPRRVKRLTALPVVIVLTLFVLVLTIFGWFATRPDAPARVPDPQSEPAAGSPAESLEQAAARARPPEPRTVAVPAPPPAPEGELAQPEPKPVIVTAFHNPPPGTARGAAQQPAGTGAATGQPVPQAQPVRAADERTLAQGEDQASVQGEAPPAESERNELFAVRQSEGFLDAVGGDMSARLGRDHVRVVDRTPALTPYEIKAGAIVPAILETQIVSSQPGTIRALVREDVYDSINGKHLLIPRGSRLLGVYNSRVAWGDRRILAAFTRVLFPDGSSMTLPGETAVDGLGSSGLEDYVNNHYLRLFGNALLFSVITAGVTVSTRDTDDDIFDNEVDVGDELNRAIGQNLAYIINQLTSRNLNVAPTLEIRPGFRFGVMVTQDMAFPLPYAPMAPLDGRGSGGAGRR